MRQPGRGPCLPDKARDELFVDGEVLVHHLEGDLAVQSAVECAVDGSHPTPGHARLNQVPPVDHPADERILQSDVHTRESTAAPALSGPGAHVGFPTCKAVNLKQPVTGIAVSTYGQ